MAGDSLEDILVALRRRILRLGAAAAIAWGITAAILLLVFCALGDLVWDLPAGMRIASLLLALGLLAAVISAVMLRAFRASKDTRIIHRLDGSSHAGGQVITGYDLRQPFSVGSTLAITRGLAELAVCRATEVAQAVPGVAVVPDRPAKMALSSCLSLIVITAVATLFAPRFARTEWSRFLNPFGDHPQFSATELAVEPGDTKIRYGDGLDVRVTTIGPSVNRMELILHAAGGGETILPMFQESVDRWRGLVSTVTSDLQYLARSGTTRSYRYAVEVLTVPQIQAVTFRITPPEYTQDPVFEGPLPPQGIAALPGAKVEVVAKSNRPLAGGSILLPGVEQPVGLVRLGEPGSLEVSGTWVVAHPGSFELKVVDEAGQESQESFAGSIQLLSDGKPFARFIEPPPISLATPSVSLPIVISAEDDYGVQQLQLFRSLNDSRPLPVELPVAVPPLRRQEVSTSLPLSEFGLQPGDVIKLFARVVDNDPAGGKGGESSVVTIQIVSDEEFERMLRTREGLESMMAKYEQAERRLEQLSADLERLKKQLDKRDPNGELSVQEQERIEELERKMAADVQAIRESAKQDHPYDLDEALKQELEKLAEQVEQAQQELSAERQAAPKAGTMSKKIDDVKRRLDQKRGEFKEGVTDPLTDLSKVFPLLEDQMRFVELSEHQRDLAERISSMAGKDNPDDPSAKARMRELEEEQRKLREELGELLNDIENHLAQVPADRPEFADLIETARDFVDAVRGSAADAAMNSAEQCLAEFQGTRGHQEASRASEILLEFLSKCEACQSQGESACNGLKFSPQENAMGNTLQQLMGDAGFRAGQKPGSGSAGSGGGYSARRNGLNNIGLYGHLPTTKNPNQGGQGSRRQSQFSAGTYGPTGSDDRNRLYDPQGMLHASGLGESAVPVRYRSRVQQYFERIANEAGGAK